MRFLGACAFGVLALSCTVPLLDCTSTSIPSGPKAATIVGTGATTSQPVTSAGGTVSLQGSSITIPAGALATNQTITIQSTTSSPPSGVTNLSPIYQFGPPGLVFNKPVTIQLNFTSNGSTPAFAWTNPNSTAFGILPSKVSGGAVVAQVTHFSQGFVADEATVASLPAGSDDAGAPTSAEDAAASDDAGPPPCTVCANGFCEATCPAGSTTCGSSPACVSTSSDPANCGACGNACSSGQTCVAGACVASCAAPSITGGCIAGTGLDGGLDCSTCGVGYSVCESTCTQTSSDYSNCGGCGIACSPGQSCTDGTCTALCTGTGVCADGACAPACPAGEIVCVAAASGATGFCTSTQVDPSNCGSCGVTCSNGQVCVAGSCVGTCLQYQSPGGGTTLSDGGLECSAPLSACSGECTDLGTDPANCGACGASCSDGQSCSGGVCGAICAGSAVCTAGGTCAASCPTGQTVCTSLGVGVTSTCTVLATDPLNCGTCGHACPSGEVCSNGGCTFTCSQPGSDDGGISP